MSYDRKSLEVGISTEATLLFFMAHIFIGLAARSLSGFSTFYALSVFLIGAMAALSRRDVMVACAVSYITGLEVLLRMTEAGVFWEFGKYAISAVLFLALSAKKRQRRPPFYLILYLMFLLPAISMTPYEDWTQWRKVISFIMSGPLSLCLCGLYFSRLTLSKDDLRKIFTYLLGPAVSIAIIVLSGMMGVSAIGWGRHSLKITSGGFGPNQVCSILGLSAFLALAYCMLTKKNRILRIIYLVLSLWLFTHAILTFSRGGVLGASVPFLIFLLTAVKSKRNRMVTLFIGILFISSNYYYIIPKLDEFTKGGLSARYAEREKVAGVEVYSTTNRAGYFFTDIEVFKKNFLWGIGVGNMMWVHFERTGEKAQTHTEWSRMLAEHGMLGLISMLFLVMWFFKRYRVAEDPLSRSLVIYFTIFIIFYMGHSATRLVLPGFAMGLLSTNFDFTESGAGTSLPDNKLTKK